MFSTIYTIMANNSIISSYEDLQECKNKVDLLRSEGREASIVENLFYHKTRKAINYPNIYLDLFLPKKYRFIAQNESKEIFAHIHKPTISQLNCSWESDGNDQLFIGLADCENVSWEESLMAV